MEAKEIMQPAFTMTGEYTLADVNHRLLTYFFGHIPIVDQKKQLVGIISESDIMPLRPSRYIPFKEQEEKIKYLENTLISDFIELGHEKVIFVTQDTDVIEVIDCLCNPPKKNGYINLVPVVKSKRDRQVVGVILWRELFEHWADLPDSQSVSELTAAQIAIPLGEFPSTILGMSTIAFAVNKLRHSEHRHLIVFDDTDQKVIDLFSDRDLAEYTPLENTVSEQSEIIYYNGQLSSEVKIMGTTLKIKPRYLIPDITINSSDTVWGSETSIINRFLSTISDKNIPFSQRLDALLVVSDKDDSEYIGIITPFNCLEKMLKKNVSSTM